MNVQKFFLQDINDQIEKSCIWGLRLHFLAKDLRTFANAAGTKDLNELREYNWFKHHFNGGFSAGEGFRVANNENYNGWKYCIRETQSNVLNTTSKKGNLGADLISGNALLYMQRNGKSGLEKEDFSKESGNFHCEHNIQVDHISKVLLCKVFTGHIDPLSLVRFVIDHSLVVTVLKSERKDGGNNRNNNIAPCWRYTNENTSVLQITDTGYVDVNSCTIQEINSNRWNRNKYFKEFRKSLEDISQNTIDKYRDKVWASIYNKDPCSSTSPILDDDKILKILLKNDQTEIAQICYPDKFKDRWKKL